MAYSFGSVDQKSRQGMANGCATVVHVMWPRQWLRVVYHIGVHQFDQANTPLVIPLCLSGHLYEPDKSGLSLCDRFDPLL